MKSVAIKHDLLELLFKQSIISGILTIFNAGLLSSLLHQAAPSTYYILWFSLIGFITIIRMGLYALFHRSEREQYGVWEKPFAGVLLFNSACWGAAGFGFIKIAPPELSPIIALFMTVYAAGSAYSYSALRYLSITSSLLTLVPLAIALLLDEREWMNLAGISSVAFCLSLIYSSKTLSKRLIQSFAYSYDLNEQAKVLSEANERAEKAVKSRGQFVASLSHEIRTPLNVILGMAEIIRRRVKGVGDKKLLRDVDVVLTSSEHLASLVSNVLDFSKIDSNKLEVEQSEFDLKKLINSATSLFRQTAKEKGLAFRLELSELNSNRFLGDPRKISQILINVIGNAVKYTDSGSVRVRVNELKSEQGVEFIISDTGPGISEDNQTQIFQPYFQNSELKREDIVSTGLGLTIVKRLVMLLDGRIELISKFGEGAQFKIFLPLEPLAGSKELSNSVSLDDFTLENIEHLSVLVADDSELNLELFDALFSEIDLPITKVRSGQQAVDAFALEHYPIVVLDIQMQGMGGLEACRRIREIEANIGDSRSIIIIQSADNRAENPQLAKEVGANYFLPKPFKLERIVQIVQEASQLKTKSLGLIENTNANRLDHLIPQFKASMLEELISSFDALKNSDNWTLQKAAHRMKGYCGFFDYPELAGICLEIENLSQSGAVSSEEISMNLHRIKENIDAIDT
ncbi:Autoinducer 2 sensor kinase/phosphatase LuxQ [Marinobacterium sp. xm-d-420]|uniref:ATP-binding protein n=1 Tax=Marinobacterium sp. xm-d-420 TaxID=2497737 RepID=UPI0015690060|nr:Autoinducer 2 sensor kinase/phosphatase LuxQ [Marinobacterium sp. xm-d-420]